MSTPQLVVHRSKELMAEAAAARLITAVVDAQAARGTASVVLTGGRNGNGLLAALAAAPARDAIDWSRLDLWWGDERFLPGGDPERNVTQAREALLDRVPLAPARVHAVPASDGPHGDDADAAAA
ncbi:6-phosphogluconolactonase, partial [Streptomyces filamentosus]|uniref:6-phosphogluconolactonase n=1 Tax=Streptomyces filamentosus TaxID=67294 RepID=UPI00332A0CA6